MAASGDGGADGGAPVALAPKFRPPALRPGLVERPRLTRQLADSADRLVMVTAPPGFGKSTLLAQWAAADPRRFAFVSLTAAENDPVELWSCVVSSVRQAAPSFGASVEPMLHSVGGTAVEPLVRRIAAELDQLSEPLVIVLDDYHAITSRACHASVEALTTEPMSDVHLVVSTRSDPVIAMGRLRASGQLTEIRARDLAFIPDETAELLNGVLGLGLAADELKILQARTEGWPAGLHLAALGLRACHDRQEFLTSFGGTNRHIVDYLTEVVLAALEPDVRQYLMDTSVLGRLSRSLCDAVTGRADSAAMLDLLERSNLFLIPLDDQRTWFRYHHLFRELLLEQLGLAAPGRPAGLHRAASAWFARAGDTDAAIGHALAGGDTAAADALVIGNWTDRVASGRLATVLGWLRQFPDGHVAASAPLSVVSAWASGLLGHDAAARQSIADILAAGSSGAPLPDGSRTAEHAAALLRSLLSIKSDVDGLGQATDAVREFRGELRPDFQAVGALVIGIAAFLMGDNEVSRAELDRAVELATATDVWIVVVDALAFSIQVALTESRADDAQALAATLMEQAGAHGLLDLPRVGYDRATCGAALARSGRLADGDELLSSGTAQLDGWSPLLSAHARLMRAPVRRQLGDLDGARELVDEARGLLAQCESTGIIGDLVPQVARALSASHRRGADWTELTDREFSVLRLLDQGLSQRQIAQELFLSFHTVHSHTKSIYTRLGASTRDEAIGRARELDLL